MLAKVVTQTAVTGPLCKCPAPAVQRTTMKEGANRGRVFWTCSMRSCGFFEWDDAPKKVQAPATYGDTVRSAQAAVVTRNPNATKQPIDIQVVGYGDLMAGFGVSEPALQVTFPKTGTDDLVRALADIQGVAPLYVDTEQGVRIYKQQDYNAVCEVLRQHAQYDVMHPPTTVFNAVKAELHRQRPEMDWENSDIPKALQQKLMPFQREGVEFAVRKGGRVLIGDEMGLGKTIQAISLLSYYRREWPALVVVPSGLKFVWYSAVLAELPYLNPDLVQVVATSKEQLRGMFIIMSYDIATRSHEAVAKKGFRVICLDEAHSIKNDRSQRSRFMRPILKNADRLILLTGTPALNRPIELYTQVEALVKQKNHIFGDRTGFGRRYCDLKPASFGPGYDWKGHANLQELQYVLRLTCMIRREKAKVLHELPEKRRTEVHVTITEKEMKLMDANLNKLKDRFRSLDDIALVDEAADGMGASSSKPVLKKNQIVHLFCATSKAKQQPVCEYIAQSHSGEKVLIFAHHVDMLNSIQNCVVGLCKKHNSDPSLVAKDGMWDHVRIDGSSNAHAKKELADHFQDSKQCKFAVLSILACGVGLTFHSSSTVIFAELYWTPGQLVQAEDRVHRIGQKNQCTIKYILAQNTSDDLLWPLLNRKLAVLGATLNKRDQEDESKEAWTEDVRQFHRGKDSIVHESTSNTFFIDKNQKKTKGARVTGPSKPSDNLQQGTLSGWGVKKPEAEQPPLQVPPVPAPLPQTAVPVPPQPATVVPAAPVLAQYAAPGPLPLQMASRPNSAPQQSSAPVPFNPRQMASTRPTPFVPSSSPVSSRPTPFIPQSGPKPFIPNVQAAPTSTVQTHPVSPLPFVSNTSAPASRTQPSNPNAPRGFVPNQAPQPFRPQSAPRPFVPSPLPAVPVPSRSASAGPTPFVPAAAGPGPGAGPAPFVPQNSTPNTPSPRSVTPAPPAPSPISAPFPSSALAVPAVSPGAAAVLETSPQKRRRKFALLGGSPQTPKAVAHIAGPPQVPTPARQTPAFEPRPQAQHPVELRAEPVAVRAMSGQRLASVPAPVPAPVPMPAPTPTRTTPPAARTPPPSAPLPPTPSPPPTAADQSTSPDFNPYMDLLQRSHTPAASSGKSGDMMEKLKAVAFKRKRD